MKNENERLIELLDQKDEQIETLSEKIESMEDENDFRSHRWMMHEVVKDDTLPTPRLQMEYIHDDDCYESVWIYSMVYKHLLGYSVKVPLGETKISGMSTADYGSNIERWLPFRDGAHFRHEMKHLGLPGYILFDGVCQEYSPTE